MAATNSFLIADEAAREAVLFDAPDHTAGPILKKATEQGWTLTGLWLTHGHFDHLADHAVVRQRFPEANILLHALDQTKAQHPEVQTRLFQLPFEIPPLKADGHVTDRQKLRIGGLEVEVIHTPGHSPGGVCFRWGDHLWVGDTLFAGSVGRTDLPGGSFEALRGSIRGRLFPLGDGLAVHPGHGPSTTIGAERAANPFVGDGADHA